MTRKHILAISCGAVFLLNCSPLFAYANPSSSQFVTIPNSPSVMEFSLTAIALRPAASNLNYVIFNKELPAQSPTWEEKEIRPGYNFAFALDGRMLFPEGRDLDLNWTHLSTTSTASTAAPSASYFLGPDYEIGPGGLVIRNAVGQAKFYYDVANLSAAQTMTFGSNLFMRFFGGLSAAFLREQVVATYTGSLTGIFAGPFRTMQQVTANFNGVGPRFGIGSDYNIPAGFMPSGFGISGEGAIAAIIGSSYAKTAYTSSSQELTDIYGQNVNYQYIKDQNVTQVIPGFDAKLSVFYKHSLYKDMMLAIKAGYQAAVYVNAINQYLPGTLVTGTSLASGGIFVSTMSHRQSNYSVQGPFLEATLWV